MATTDSGSVVRTYGRRAAMKRRSTREPSELGDTPPGNATPIKRRKLSPEPIQRTPSPGGEKIGAHSNSIRRSQLRPPKPSTNATSPPPHPSPSKPIRDLSAIFDDIIPSKSLAPSPTKIAKRMLARSKTESSIESQSANESLLERTPSLPNLPSSPSKPEPSPSFSRPMTTSVLPGLPLTKKAVTRTYAGAFRSFLVPLPTSSNDPLAATMEEDELDSRESYSSLRNRWGVDNSEDDPYPYLSPSPTKSNMSSPSPSRLKKGKSKEISVPIRPLELGTMNPLKSISELRNKGESRRFLDEVGYLFEGMDSKGAIALRRASALEIATKLCDQDFTRKAKAADFFTKTWDIFVDAGAGKKEDKLLDIIFLFFISLVARDSDSLTELAERFPTSTLSYEVIPSKTITDESVGSTSFVDTLFGFLDNFPPDKDPLILVAKNRIGDIELKQIGISKRDRIMLSTVYKTISSKSELFSTDTSISISLLVSYILQTLSPSLFPVSYIPSFLRSLKLTLAPKFGTQLANSLSLFWTDTATCLPYENLSYHLRLLDAYLLDQWDSSALIESSQPQKTSDTKVEIEEALDNARDEWLAHDLVSLGVCVELNAKSDGSEYSQPCLATILRILVSLTHADELWSRKVVQCEYTMGWLLRLIHRASQDMQQSIHEKTLDNPLKDEDSDDLLLKDDDTKADGDGNSNGLDMLCLALGLLTNLVQAIDGAKHSVRETRLNPSCPLKRRICGQKCSCSGAQSGIEILAHLYARQQVKAESTTTTLSEDSPEAHAEADASFLRGHLAVLFGLLMMNCPANRPAVLSALQRLNANNRNANERSMMDKLVEHAKDFAAFYTAVSNKLGGEQDSKVAKEVVVFLEEQRNLCM